jgi:transposase
LGCCGVRSVMGDRKPYHSDLSDEQWALIGPFLQAWRASLVAVSGREGDYDLREIVNAIFYQNRTGCQWAYLPPESAAYHYILSPRPPECAPRASAPRSASNLYRNTSKAPA